MQPPAQRIRKRLRSAVNLQIATQQRSAVGSQASIDRRPQRPDGGNHANPQRETQQHDPEAPDSASEFAAGEGER